MKAATVTRITTCRATDCTAPETADHATLHRTGDAALVKTYAALTHRMDGIEITSPRGLSRSADLRAQRDLVEREILRRMDGAR